MYEPRVPQNSLREKLVCRQFKKIEWETGKSETGIEGKPIEYALLASESNGFNSTRDPRSPVIHRIFAPDLEKGNIH